MAKTSGLWQRGGRGMYDTTLHGKQIPLSLDKKEAEKALHELLADPPEAETGFRPSIGKMCDLFLDYSQKNHEPDTYKWYKWFFQSLCGHVKKGRKVYELKVHMITGWLAANPQWGNSSKCTAISIALNWGINQGYLKSHPLKGMKRGKMDRRERILMAEERAKINDCLHDVSFKQYLTFLEQTGCRPGEAAKLTAGHVDLEAGTATLEKHKTVKKTRKSRAIYLTSEAKELIGMLMKMHPEGPLFRSNVTGKAWTKEGSYSKCKTIVERAKIPPFTCYSYRHTFIVDALTRGLTADVVAELVGNSPLTITRCYSHLDAKKDFLKAAQHAVTGTESTQKHVI